MPLYLEDCPDVYVNLDATACSVAMENAVTNAIRHHDPGRPGISMIVEANAEAGRVFFTLVNQVVDNAHPMFWNTINAADAVRSPVSYRSNNSNTGIGLRHIYLAVKPCGGFARLGVQNGLATFNFTIPSTIIQETEIPVLVPNLQMLFVDDSAVARKTATNLLPSVANNATVNVFGRSPSDIDLFRHTVSHSAPDIVILDQNLDFGGTLVLGTDLIEEIKQHDGLYQKTTFAIRSANCTAKDRLLYMSSGADCVLNKECDWKSACRILACVHNEKTQKETHNEYTTLQQTGPYQVPENHTLYKYIFGPVI